ncbi:MAG: sensor histidine kinase, partial [Gemmatimonadales bacterium]
GRLASGVAHDFNNLLTVVTVSLESIRLRLGPTPDIAEDLGLMESAIKGAGNLVRQLVTYAKGSGEGARSFDASARLRESLELLRNLAGRNVHLELIAPESALRVALHATRFDQVVQNLVVNAREAMPAGGSLKIIATEVLRMPAHSTDGTPLAGGRYLQQEFADTCGGIAADVEPQIYEPFFTTNSRSGSGLGLATVQRIVREANGDVVASSAVGHGTRFDVFLPLPPHAPADSPTAA